MNIFGRISELKAELNAITEETNRSPDEIKSIKTGIPCEEGDVNIRSTGDICMICEGGEWIYKAGAFTAENRGEYKAQPRPINTPDFSLDVILDDDNCTVIGYKPKVFATGKFGYWESEETYPDTLNDRCEPIYGDLAGKPIRMFKVPSTSILPSFISFKGGVPNQHDSGNVEDDDSYVFMYGFDISNIEIPDTPKPLCKDNPFSIMIAERTEANKTVVGTGIAIATFKGTIQGQDYAVPKIGVNSVEYFDREINPSGPDSFRGGSDMDKAAYIIHSPDLNFRRPTLNATYALFEEELNGSGFRHGLYARGIVPDSKNLGRENQKGTRQSILLNKSAKVEGEPTGKVKCVQALSYAPEHSIVNKENKFTYSLLNLWKESSVYAEFKNAAVKLTRDATHSANGKNATNNLTSDDSFIGDTVFHQSVINNARTHKISLIREVPRQYGSLISMMTIPIGLEGKKIANGATVTAIDGLFGDSHINPYTVKRHSYVSDKVPKNIAPGLFEAKVLNIKQKLIGALLNPLFRVIGLQRIGDVPVSGTVDPRNQDGGLRNGAAPSGTDHYFPHVVKTNIWFWSHADFNIDYRQVGNTDLGEVHSQRLKELMLDSSFPDGWDWSKTFLNRFYSAIKEPPKWKIISRVLMSIIFTFGVGLYFIINGFSDLSQAVSQIGGGTVGLQTIGAIIAAFIAMLKIYFGIAWIVFFVSSDIDNKIIDHMLGIDLTVPDVVNADGSFSMYDGRLRQAGETNYHRYNADIDKKNNIEVAFTMSDPYHVDQCDVYDNVIHYSEPQNINSPIDAWQNFKVNNVFSIPVENGKLKKLFMIGEAVFAHTTDNIIKIEAGRNQIQSTAGTTYLGAGELFGMSEPLYGGVLEGFGGLKDPNAAIMTTAGYIFPDREARTWYIFNGTAVSKLGAKNKRASTLAASQRYSTSPLPQVNGGVEMFFENFGDFELLRAFPEFKNVDEKSINGIGYSVGIDNSLDRLLITKIDYRPLPGAVIPDINTANLKDIGLFCDVSYTISFDMGSYEAISFHSYKPMLYAWNRHDMYSFASNRMLLHNIRGLFLEYDCKPLDFSVEIVVAMGENFKFESSKIDTELFEWNGCDYQKRIKTFNKLIAYNDNQCTGELTMKLKQSLMEDSLSEVFYELPVKYNLKRFAFSELYSKVVDPEKSMFYCQCNPTELKVNSSNLSKSMRDQDFRNTYLIMRFTLDKNVHKKSEKLILKQITTDIDYEVES